MKPTSTELTDSPKSTQHIVPTNPDAPLFRKAPMDVEDAPLSAVDERVDEASEEMVEAVETAEEGDR